MAHISASEHSLLTRSAMVPPEQPEPRSLRRLGEKRLYGSVLTYLERQGYQCWTEETLREIRKRSSGRYASEDYPTPDVVGKGYNIIVAVEVKPDTSLSSICDCIGKVALLSQFMNKVYAAFPSPIPENRIQTMKEIVPMVGLLEVDPLKASVQERTAARDSTPSGKHLKEWRWYSLELIRAEALPKAREPGSSIISDVECRPGENLVIIRINDPVDDQDLAEEVINTRWIDIDEAINDRGLRTKFGERTRLELVSEYWEICQQCNHVKGKGYLNCPTCHPNMFIGPEDRGGFWWGRPFRSEKDEI